MHNAGIRRRRSRRLSWRDQKRRSHIPHSSASALALEQAVSVHGETLTEKEQEHKRALAEAQAAHEVTVEETCVEHAEATSSKEAAHAEALAMQSKDHGSECASLAEKLQGEHSEALAGLRCPKDQKTETPTDFF